ncbi:hypothetical protein pb186bvf_000043 [Paramecium bursaria]
MVLFTEIIGGFSFFYGVNYAIYRYYFRQPLKQMSLNQILRKNLKIRWFNRYLQKNQYIEITCGINYKPLKAKYQDAPQENSDFNLLFNYDKGQYWCINELNNQLPLKLQTELQDYIRKSYRNYYVKASIFNSRDDMHNYIYINLQQYKFNQVWRKLEQIEYNNIIYVITNDEQKKVIIYKILGENYFDVDYIDQIINITVKKELDYPHQIMSKSELSVMLESLNKDQIRSIMEINQNYELIGYEYGNVNVYKKIIQNLNNRVL